ncbi:MAG: hypothetical protein BMS9Abin15_0136 [Gammaproteobacteria bacterium]|nr:MAG: hypothetical protein BMS9Abin15_0136 [Gammaproteobacteria bacterium]
MNSVDTIGATVMNRRPLIVFLILLGVIAGGVAIFWQDKPDQAEASSAEAQRAGGGLMVMISGDEQKSFTYEEVKNLVNGLSKLERSKLLASDAALVQFLKRNAARKSLISAALEQGLGNEPAMVGALKRQVQQSLINAYINRNVVSTAPAGYPSDEQVRQFYQQNKARLKVPQQVRVWQIFIPFNKPNKTGNNKAEAKKLAADLVKQLRKKKTNFAEAAKRYSAHQASREKGGDMGMVNVGSLRPELRAVILALKPGKISDPVTGSGGMHIFKTGKRNPERTLSQAEASPRIRALLQNNYVQQRRQALLQQAQGKFPVKIPTKALPRWRKNLTDDAQR